MFDVFFQTQFRQAGYSAIELLVVLSILVVLAGMALVNLNSPGNDRQFVQRNMNSFVSVLEHARSMSDGQELNYNSGSGLREVPLGGYGVAITSSGAGNFVLFADFDGDGEVDASEILESFTLDQVVMGVPEYASLIDLRVVFPIADSGALIYVAHDNMGMTEVLLEDQIGVEFSTPFSDAAGANGTVSIYGETGGITSGF